MILKNLLIILLLPIICANDGLILSGRVGAGSSVTVIKNYMGQKPPGIKPEVFAPDFISTDDHEFGGAFSPDLSEFYFNRGKDIWVTKKSDTGWITPQKADFNSKYLDNEPAISPDNRFLFFGSKRPHKVNNYSDEYGIWMVNRKGTTWSEPTFVGPAAYLSFAADGSIYSRSIQPVYEEGCIEKTYFLDGKFSECIPQKGGIVDTPKDYLQGVHPCISADQSFMFFVAMYQYWGNSPELFISYREGENDWGPAINLSEVLGMKGILNPRISPDMKYLFFYHEHDIYWVDLKFIDDLKFFPK